MERTDNLDLPYIMPSQAQKHVTHNEALRALDALVQLSVSSRTVSAPPTDPQPGLRHIVPAGASGAWAGCESAVAAWQDGGWTFYGPTEGWLAHVADENTFLVFADGEWDRAAIDAILPERLGINATAEAPNRLALAGAASLFTHEGAGHQIKINKSAPGDTAALVFQTGYSGRAEFGLAGDDDFHVKVSPDGAQFIEAMVIERGTGRASFPAGILGVRERLSADRTYYVDPAGNDGDDGLSAASAFATLQNAVDVAHGLDCGTHGIIIRLAGGIHAGAAIVRPLLGGGLLTIIGNDADPAQAELSSASTVTGAARVAITGVRFVMQADWHNALTVSGSASLSIGRVDFGPCAANASHVVGRGAGEISVDQDYVISGGATRHINLSGHLTLLASNRTVELIGDPAFSNDFLHAANGATISLWEPSFIGAATGRRYSAIANAIINTFGKPAGFLPGDVAGMTTTGGIYA